MPRRFVCALVVVALVASPLGAAEPVAPLVADPDRYLALAWEPGVRAGQPIVHGSLSNLWAASLWRVQLLVESLDAAGTVTGQRIERLTGTLTPGARMYFEAAVPAPAPRYRVRVFAFDRLRF